jgi:Iap family predicted aminopeptidase
MESFVPDEKRMETDWKMLCEDIGERLAGTTEEERAARYVLSRLQEAGCVNAHLEPFDCRSRRGATVSVEVDAGQGWRAVECAAVTGSGSTRGVVEGEAVWFEMPEQAGTLKPGSLKGRIGILFGPLPEVVEHHIALVQAEPLAVVHVDHRLPFGWAKNDGTYPLWVEKHGFPPLVTVPYLEAWAWRRADRLRVRVQMDMDMVEGQSQNVVAELPGEGEDSGMLLVCAHHDSQAGNVGADDNASGVVAILELARMLKGRKLKRTVRFISFGTEEQLSVGAAQYVQAHRQELDGIGLMVNFDSVASPLGHHQLFCAGKPQLARYALDRLKESNFHVQLKREAVPFADHFPFTVYGVPALWFFRANFPGGRWQHHSVHDNLENVSVRVLSDLVGAACGLIVHAATIQKLPFQRGLDPVIREKTLLFARTLVGLPE